MTTSPKAVKAWERMTVAVSPTLAEASSSPTATSPMAAAAWDKVVNLGGLAGQVRELRASNRALSLDNTRMEKQLAMLSSPGVKGRSGSVSELAKRFSGAKSPKSSPQKQTKEQLRAEIKEKDMEIAALVELATKEESESAAQLVAQEQREEEAVRAHTLARERIAELEVELAARPAAAAPSDASGALAAARQLAAAEAARADAAERRCAGLTAQLAAALATRRDELLGIDESDEYAPPPPYQASLQHATLGSPAAAPAAAAAAAAADAPQGDEGVDEAILAHFRELTATDRDVASRFLIDAAFDVELAVRAFYSERDAEGGVAEGSAAVSRRTSAEAQEESDFQLAQALHAMGTDAAGAAAPAAEATAAPQPNADAGVGGQTAAHIAQDAHVARGLLREEVQMKGTLDKMARISKARGNWTTRYFELHGDVLSYFKDAKSVFKSDGEC